MDTSQMHTHLPITYTDDILRFLILESSLLKLIYLLQHNVTSPDQTQSADTDTQLMICSKMPQVSTSLMSHHFLLMIFRWEIFTRRIKISATDWKNTGTFLITVTRRSGPTLTANIRLKKSSPKTNNQRSELWRTITFYSILHSLA